MKLNCVINFFKDSVVYKIPYRRAPRLAYVRPLGRVRRASKGILHTKDGDAVIGGTLMLLLPNYLKLVQ